MQPGSRFGIRGSADGRMGISEQKKESLTTQSVWILVAKIAGFALNTMLPLLVVRYLTQENVGVYRQAFLVAANAVLVLPFGFSMSAYYYLNRDPEKHHAAVLNILAFNFLMGAAAFLVLFLFPGVLGATFQSEELTRLSPLIGIVIWLWIFSSFLETAALAQQEARLGAVFIVFSQGIKTLLMIGAVVMFRTVDSIICAAIAVFAGQSVLLVAYLHKRFPRFWAHIDLPFFRRQFAYTVPFGLSVMLYVGQTDIHNYFVSHSFSAAEFAIYSVGCFQLPLITLLYESVGSVMIPKMSQLQDEDKKGEMLRLTVTATQKLAFFYFPLFAFLMVVASEFITTLFTSQYAASAAIFRVNLFALPLFSLVVDPITRAYPKAAHFLLRVRVGIVIVLLAVFWYGIGRFGLLDMIAIVAASIVFEKLVAAWISARMLEVRFSDLHLLKPIGKIAAAASAAAVVLVVVYAAAAGQMMNLFLALAERALAFFGLAKGFEFVGGCMFLGLFASIFGTAYLVFAIWLGAVDPDDKEKFSRLLRRAMPRRSSEPKAA